jgi:hypothetical protein
MKAKLIAILAIVGFQLLGLGATAFGQESGFFRIVSTQQTQVVSIDSHGVLSWVNSVSNAPCRIEACRSINGNWTSNFPSTTLQSTGMVARVRVPMLAVAGEIIVGFQDTVSEAQANALMQSFDLVWVSEFSHSFAYWVKVLSGTPADYIPRLEASDIVRWAQQRGKPDGETGASYLLVQFTTAATQETAQKLITTFPGLQLDSIVLAPKWGLVYVPAGTEQLWIARFLTHPEVRSAELNQIVSLY